MKVLLYTEAMNLLGKSGVGKARSHQIRALEQVGVEWTTDPKEKVDLVHINTIFTNSHRLAKKAKKQGIPVVYHAHSTMEDFKNSYLGANAVAPLFKKWLCSCYRLGDSLITPTPYAKHLVASYGLTQPIYSCSNGIDLEYYEKDEEAGKAFRKRFGFSPEDKIVMSVGLQIERKGILDFVELARRMPEYQFIWFGYSSPWTIPAKIRKAVRTKLPNLHFPGYIDEKILRTAYWGADCFLFLTHEETEGIVLLEALAARQKVLIRDIPIYEEWLEDGKNIYKADSLDSFEAKLRGILEGKLPDLTEAGYQVAWDRRIEAVGQTLDTIYEETIRRVKERAAEPSSQQAPANG